MQIDADILKPKFEDYTLTSTQTINDLLKGIFKAIKESEEGAKVIAPMFKRSTRVKTCFVLFHFLKRNVNYKAEAQNGQTAKTLQRIIFDKQGDCKHYSIFCASILKALNIPFKLRLISQDQWNKEPKHIYLIVKDEKGKNICLDATLKNFNKECFFHYKYDYFLT